MQIMTAGLIAAGLFLVGSANATENVVGQRAMQMAAEQNLPIPPTLGALGNMHCNSPPVRHDGFVELCYYLGADRRASVMRRDAGVPFQRIERFVFDLMGGRSGWSMTRDCENRSQPQNLIRACTLVIDGKEFYVSFMHTGDLTLYVRDASPTPTPVESEFLQLTSGLRLQAAR